MYSCINEVGGSEVNKCSQHLINTKNWVDIIYKMNWQCQVHTIVYGTSDTFLKNVFEQTMLAKFRLRYGFWS